MADREKGMRRRVEWLRSAPDSFLVLGHSWGIVEVIETKLHTQLMKLDSRHEEAAREARISKRALKMLDFTCLWESQIEAAGKVLFVTADESLWRFGSDVAAECSGGSNRRVVVLLADELDRRFASDRMHGGQKLCEAASRAKAAKFCGSVLSAGLMSKVLSVSSKLQDRRWSDHQEDPQKRDRGGLPAAKQNESLRRELREAMALVATARQLLESTAAGEGFLEGREVDKCLEKMDNAQRRWQTLLARRWISKGSC